MHCTIHALRLTIQADPDYTINMKGVDIKGLSGTFTVFDTFGDVVNVIVRNGMVIAGVICLIILVLGGFRYIMAAGGGDAKQMESGKKAITGAVIGLVLIVFAVWIVQIIKTITGYDFIQSGL